MLSVLKRGYGVRACAQEVAHTLVLQLGVEACAVVLREPGNGTLWLAGVASQADRLGGPSTPDADTAWLTLAGLVGPERDPVGFRRASAGDFVVTPVGELRDDGFLVLPLGFDDAPGGALLLRLLAPPAQGFARGSGLALVADLVASTLAVARGRDASGWLCDRLSAELGAAQRALGEHAASLRARESHIEALTRELARVHGEER